MMGHGDIGDVPGGTENQAFDIGIGIFIAENLIGDKAAHDEIAGDPETLWLTNQAFGHTLVHPGAEIAEAAVHFVGVGGVDHVPAFLHLVYQSEQLAGGRLAVVVQRNDEIPGTVPVTGHQGCVLAEVFGQINAGDMGIRKGKGANARPDPIRGTVVDQNDFVIIFRALLQGFADFIYYNFNCGF